MAHALRCCPPTVRPPEAMVDLANCVNLNPVPRPPLVHVASLELCGVDARRLPPLWQLCRIGQRMRYRRAPAACCLGGSNCVVLVPTTCLSVGGEVRRVHLQHRAPACPADLDGNGSVDFADLVSMLSGWGQPGAADLDESGLVDFNDVIILLGVWGECEG